MQILARVKNKKGSRSGLSLLEILLVLTLIGLLSTSVGRKVFQVSRTNTRSSVRRFASLVRHAYDQAILTGLVHRIVVDLDNQNWKLQSAPQGILPIEKATKELALKETDDDFLKSQEEAQAAYKDTKLSKSSIKPPGVSIVEVSSWRLGGLEEAVQEGTVSIYAFPTGRIDEASITLAQEGREDIQRFRLTTKTLTGRVSIEVENKE